MKKYFAAENTMGSSASHGFANTWEVLVFNNKKDRDRFVEASYNITVKAILKREATKYAANWYRPRPFSGEYWGIDTFDAENRDIPGYIGNIAVCTEEYTCIPNPERLY